MSFSASRPHKQAPHRRSIRRLMRGQVGNVEDGPWEGLWIKGFLGEDKTSRPCGVLHVCMYWWVVNYWAPMSQGGGGGMKEKVDEWLQRDLWIMSNAGKGKWWWQRSTCNYEYVQTWAVWGSLGQFWARSFFGPVAANTVEIRERE